MMKLIFTILFAGLTLAQNVYTQKDLEICNFKYKYADSLNLSDKPINEVFVEIAKSFIGLDYEANTLQCDGDEKLIIHLSGLDCYTFMEASLVFARTIKSGNTDFDNYSKELESIRYRDGKISGYPSRLHYFSDWLYEKEKEGLIELISENIGGQRYEKEINFMSAHPQYYKELKNNLEFVAEIKKTESAINQRKYFYIPQEKISQVENKINNGDIVGITTSINGLDISHVGIAIKKGGRIFFLHAPIAGKKIQISSEPLCDYIMGNKKQTGIMLARINELKK